MKWVQRDDWHWERGCGRYTVSRAMMFDANPMGAWRYSAWRRGGEMPEQLGNCTDDFSSAVALCAADIRQLERREAA